MDIPVEAARALRAPEFQSPPDGIRARSLTVSSLGDERRRSGRMSNLALALPFVLALALAIGAIYMASTS